MGCCQSSTISSSEQANFELSKDILNKPEALNSSISILQIPDIHLLKFENLKTSAQTSPDRSYFTLDSKIFSNSFFSRFSCTFSKSGLQKEALIIRKSSLFMKDCQNLIENTAKLSQFSSEHIVRVYYIAEDKDFIKIITEPCGQNTLEEVIQNNSIPTAPALSFLKQLAQAITQYHRLGITLKHLTEKDVFLINNVLKISISAAVIKITEFEAPDFELSPKNDVWNLGVIFLKLLFAPYDIRSVQDGLDRLDSLSLSEADKKQINSFFKPLFQRPNLAEVSQFKWSVESKESTKKQNYVIEKISEELSDNLSLEEHQSSRIEKSEGSSNEFYQSEDLADQEELKNEEEQKLTICEILNNQVIDIQESQPDHEESSLENEAMLCKENKASLIISDIIQDTDRPALGNLQSSLSKTPEPCVRRELRGIVKFFSLKQKSGLIHCPETNEDYPITQHDLVLSKPNLSQLTKHLLSGSEIEVKFSLIPGTGHLAKITYS